MWCPREWHLVPAVLYVTISALEKDLSTIVTSYLTVLDTPECSKSLAKLAQGLLHRTPPPRSRQRCD